MGEPTVLVEKGDGIATVTLNRPEALNALSTGLRDELTSAFESIAGDTDIGVVILTGAGRAFSAGVDLKELGRSGTRDYGRPEALQTPRDPVVAMSALAQPILGAINGYAITGGFEIALACDLLIASTEARFADTHARVGILPGWGLSQRLGRAIGLYRAKELSLTGNYLDAERAYQWGLVSRVVEPEQLLPTCRALAADILSCDRRTVHGYKEVIDEGFALSFGEGMTLEKERSRAHSRDVRAEEVEQRRSRIQQRGRDQSRRA
jgi:enoyl-CoA hydratase